MAHAENNAILLDERGWDEGKGAPWGAANRQPAGIRMTLRSVPKPPTAIGQAPLHCKIAGWQGAAVESGLLFLGSKSIHPCMYLRTSTAPHSPRFQRIAPGLDCHKYVAIGTDSQCRMPNKRDTDQSRQFRRLALPICCSGISVPAESAHQAIVVLLRQSQRRAALRANHRPTCDSRASAAHLSTAAKLPRSMAFFWNRILRFSTACPSTSLFLCCSTDSRFLCI
jgi:hypothetical protein